MSSRTGKEKGTSLVMGRKPYPSDTKPCPTCGKLLTRQWENNKSRKDGGALVFRCGTCINKRNLTKQPTYIGEKGRPHRPHQKLQGEYAPQPTGKICETCNREIYRYWNASPRYKKGGTWNAYCPGCAYHKKKDQDPNYHKNLYARRKELYPNLSQMVSHWIREWDLQKKYHISSVEYDQLLEKQNGVCAICKQEETTQHYRNGKILRLAVDHDHETGAVRGLLCSQCNLLLGLVENHQDLLKIMQEYLDKKI